MKPTVSELNKNFQTLDSRTTRLETETSIQFKDLFNRVKRLESILLASTGAIVLLLVSVIIRM